MCGGVAYLFEDELVRTYFPNPKSTIPVQTRQGDLKRVAWGRRKEQPGNLPLGGWARLDSIYAGKWDKYFPKPVKCPIASFMEKDIEGSSHWYDLMPGQVVQGLVARSGDEQRLYIVTISPEQENAVHERWPRVINA